MIKRDEANKTVYIINTTAPDAATEALANEWDREDAVRQLEAEGRTIVSVSPDNKVIAYN